MSQFAALPSGSLPVPRESALNTYSMELWEEIIVSMTDPKQIKEFAKTSKQIANLIASEATRKRYVKTVRLDETDTYKKTWHQDINGLYQGPLYYKSTGGISITGPFVDGKYHGPWIYRDASTRIYEIRNYENGYLVSSFTDLPNRLENGGPNAIDYEHPTPHTTWPTRKVEGCNDVMTNDCSYVYAEWYNAVVPVKYALPSLEDAVRKIFDIKTEDPSRSYFDTSVQRPAVDYTYAVNRVEVVYFGRLAGKIQVLQRDSLRSDVEASSYVMQRFSPDGRSIAMYRSTVEPHQTVHVYYRNSMANTAQSINQNMAGLVWSAAQIQVPTWMMSWDDVGALRAKQKYSNGKLVEDYELTDDRSYVIRKEYGPGLQDPGFAPPDRRTTLIDISDVRRVDEDIPTIQRVEDAIVFNSGRLGQFPPVNWVRPAVPKYFVPPPQPVYDPVLYGPRQYFQGQ